MARSGSYSYDPKKGEWSKSIVPVSSEPEKTTNDIANQSSSDKLTSSNTDNTSAKGSTEKKQNSIEYNVLEGALEVIITSDTIKMKSGDTIELLGLGKYLSGNYFVQDVSKTYTRGAFKISATLIKTNFGSSLKSSSSTAKPVTARKEAISTKVESKSYVVKKGDSLWKIAQQFYGDGSEYEKIAKANNISSKNYNSIPIGLKLIIP